MRYITKISLFSLVLFSLVSCKKKDETIKKEAELRFLRAELCTSDNTTPIAYKTFGNETGQVLLKPRTSGDSTFYILLDNKAEKLNICKFPPAFKKAGIKIQVDGTAYYLECTGAGPCGSSEGTHFIIKSIKML